jgi:hypothetical protein
MIDAAGLERKSSTAVVIKPANPPENGAVMPAPPAGTRKAAKPPLACGFVTTKRPKTESGRGQETHRGQGAEPR